MPTPADLVHQAHFAESIEAQRQATFQLLEMAAAKGMFPSSVHDLYRARGAGALPADTFTVPAFNLRGMSFLTAQAAFQAALDLNVGVMIFELARSEMRYTLQTPTQVTASVIGAALVTGWTGPVYIQGDHYQPKPNTPGTPRPGEVTSIQDLIRESLSVGFYNIDIDGSTLVDNTQPTEYDQQRPNFLFTAEMIRFIDHTVAELNSQRANKLPSISIGCEISEVGTHLSKSSQLAAFMTGLRDEGNIPEHLYPTKVAIETGTAHGGKVNPDGTAAAMHVDFEQLQAISMIARRKYDMAGAVQHGASTLDKEIMQRFPKAETAEIHLSTGFQNTLMDHPAFPRELLGKMYTWCEENCAKERKETWTDAQFLIKTRKKAWGEFKKETWLLPASTQKKLYQALYDECASYYTSLGVADSRRFLKEYLK